MPRPIKLPEKQLTRVHELEKRFSYHLSNGSLRESKIILDELKGILYPYHHNARVLENYLKLYEVALESWQIDLAKRGFQFVRDNCNKNTRLYLEATTLLAICHLREQNIFSAEPLIAEVLKNENIIKSEKKKIEFRREIIERFDEEGVLAALAKSFPELKSEAEVHSAALEILKQGKSEGDIQEMLGESVPQDVKDFLLKVDQMSKNMLTYEHRLMLPSPKEVIKNKSTGDIIFRGLRRKLYKYICSEDSELYQAWLKNGLNAILDKGYVAGVVIAALTDVKIGASGVAIGVTALLMNQGINNFFENHKPSSLMVLRK